MERTESAVQRELPLGRIDQDTGHLVIGGCDTVDLATHYGTPLFIYDESQIRQTIRAFLGALEVYPGKVHVSYASKAFSTTAMCQLVADEGLGIDVVSGGELYTALRANVPPEKIHFHGNNKTEDELRLAIREGVGAFIVDNFVELDQLASLAAEKQESIRVLLRVSPGVSAHTHEYISTGQQDSKFGFDFESGQASDALTKVKDYKHLTCVGLHAHIGSQIFESQGFMLMLDRLFSLYRYGLELHLPLCVLNVGGGFGIRYTNEDALPPEVIAAEVAKAVVVHCNEHSLPYPELWFEPGRSIVGPAGITVYRVGTQKRIPGVRNYVAVDGGMTDNPRLALYGAKYHAILANRALDAVSDTFAVAGKCCESGDMIIWDAPLPDPQRNDLLAVFATGAYNYSMASHYNRIPKPAVVFVHHGEAKVVVERETWEDLVRRDRPLW